MNKEKRFRGVIRTAINEIGEFSARKYALFGATATGLVFEWSPANEALLGAVGIATHEQVGSGTTVVDSVMGRFITGTVTGGISFSEQAIVGSLTALSIHQFPKTFKYWQDSRPKNALQSVSTASSAVTALGLGSSMSVLEKNIIDKNTSKKDSLETALKTSAIVGGANFILAGVVSGALDVLERNGQEATAHNLENVIKNPFLYIGLFGTAKIISVLRDKKNNNKCAK